jgi:hypothetical protein
MLGEILNSLLSGLLSIGIIYVGAKTKGMI